MLEVAINESSDAVYVDNAAGGRLVTPVEAYLSLVEHLERWATCLGTHGLLVLELSNLDVRSTREYSQQVTSMHLDAVQAHSGQMVMPAAHFSLAAASVGLMPTAELLAYPKDAPFTRIVLQQLLPASFAIRLAALDDLPQLVELETFWKDSHLLAATESTLRRRITAHPAGQYVAVSTGGELLAAMYTQRVASDEVLTTAMRASELDLHSPTGSDAANSEPLQPCAELRASSQTQPTSSPAVPLASASC